MEHDNMPLVSVVMATFNEPSDIIRQSINSILNQSYPKFELIIIDDSTSSDTISAINELSADERIIVIRNPERIGFVKALNIGLKTAKGKYIARMDGDDVSMPDRFRIQISFLENNPEYSVTGGAINIINRDGILLSKRTYPSSSLKLACYSIFRSPLAHPTIMMRRQIIDDGFFYDESYKKSEDLEFWLRLMKNRVKLYNLQDVLLNFRVEDNLGNKRTREHFSYNFKARLKNFRWGSPFRSLLSLFFSFAYIISPTCITNKIYSLENKQKDVRTK